MELLTEEKLRSMSRDELIDKCLSLQKELACGREIDRLDEGGLFRAFAENIQVMLYVLNEQGEIIYANPFSSEFSGYSNSELLGLPGYATIHPEDRPLAMERNQARLRGEKVPDHYDIRLQLKGGVVKWVELHMKKLVIAGRSVTLGTAIDITDRKESEASLKRSEEKFRAFAENLQVMVYTYDENGMFTYANRICEQVTGYSRQELLRMTMYEVVDEDYRDLSRQRAVKRRQGQSGGEVYLVLGLTKDGRRRWWELSGVPLPPGADGKITVLGNAVDVHERIESELALRESEAKFRKLFESSSDPMLLLDKDGFIGCNQAAINDLKAGRREDVFRHPAEISPEYQPDGQLSRLKAEKIIAETFRRGSNRFEWLHVDLHGNPFWADVSLTVIPFENRKIIFTVWRDISDFKRLEQQLRDERERLLVTLRSIGDAVIATDTEGRISLLNRVAERLTGWSQEEAVGRRVEEVMRVVSSLRGEVSLNLLAEAIERGQVVEAVEGRTLYARDGSRRQIADCAAPIRDEKQRIIGGILVFRDISDQERLQEEVLKLRKLESVGRLAGGIAHDFNNLLTGIMGHIEIASRRADAERARLSLEKALKASRRAAELTQKLLTFAKGGEPVKQSADLAEIIRDSAEFVLAGSKVALEMKIEDELLAAEFDPGQISQVVQNLVLNAEQAMPEGGTIFIRADNFRVWPSEGSVLPLGPGPYVKVAVRDQGEGIDPALREKIFDPFFTTRENGSGLGLSVIHSIVSKHGGHVTVHSQVGEFSEFIFFLPARAPAG